MEAQEIIAAVEQHYRLSSGALLSVTKARQVAWPRQLAMYLVRIRLDWSYPRIARAFDRKDHTTIMHACKAVPMRLMRVPTIGQDLLEIHNRLRRGVRAANCGTTAVRRAA